MIESIKHDEITDAGNLIKDVFNEFIAADFSAEGIGNFYQRVSSLAIMDRIQAGNRINVFKSENEITGYIEVSGTNHIYFLFVKKDFQGQEIAKRLIESVIISIKKQYPDVNAITVNSTLNALKFYEKLGFVKIADFQMKNGIISFPMSLEIQ